MSDENVEMMRTSLDGWSRGDFDAWLRFAHPDLEFRTSGVYPGIDPIYRGRQEMGRFWREFREAWESIRIRVDRVREVGDVVVPLCTFEGLARDGLTVEREVGWTWRFVDGQVARIDSYGSWDEALEAVGLSE
jgi:ketosteroid isomerase-like protein